MPIDRFLPRPPEDIPAVVSPPDTVFVQPFPIGWGDLDPAQIAYTGRLPDFVVRAVEGWLGAVLGGGFFQLNRRHGIDLPFVHLAMDFIAPVTTEAPLLCAVHVDKVGTSSIRATVIGRQSGRHCFTGRTVNVAVDTTVFRPSPLKPNVRATIEAYRDRFPPPPDGEA